MAKQAKEGVPARIVAPPEFAPFEKSYGGDQRGRQLQQLVAGGALAVNHTPAKVRYKSF